jgi:hypothetical protein
MDNRVVDRLGHGRLDLVTIHFVHTLFVTKRLNAMAQASNTFKAAVYLK